VPHQPHHTNTCRPLLNTRLSLSVQNQLPEAPPGAPPSGCLPRVDGVLYLDGFLVRLLCKVVDSQHLLLLREGHGEVQEGVEGDGHLQTQEHTQLQEVLVAEISGAAAPVDPRSSFALCPLRVRSLLHSQDRDRASMAALPWNTLGRPAWICTGPGRGPQ